MGRSQRGISINEENINAHEETPFFMVQKGVHMFQNGRGLGPSSTGVEPGAFPLESWEWGSQTLLQCEVLPHAQMGHRILFHGSRWDTGFCPSLWGCRICLLVPCCVLTALMFPIGAAGAGRSWISSWEKKKKYNQPNLKELFSS